MAKTALMDEYNAVAKGYEMAITSGDHHGAMIIAKQVSEFLQSIGRDEKMYGDGDKWTTAGDLLEYNKRRIESLERSIYSLQIRKTNKRNHSNN